MDLLEIQRVGPWEFEKKLGAGGMGTVYLGRHKETGQIAAVKVLPASLAREEGFIERFKREIVSMEKVKSPHIVELLESGSEGETYYYSMEYVDGETLTSRLKRDKRMPWPEVVDLGIQICRALKSAHNAGIVHRDLKPSNLMIATDGTVKLTDFGVAQVFAERKLTVTGGIVGTAEYMSPEQAKGQRATKKSDLYSLGAVLYVMLTGRPPFSGKTSLDVIHKHQYAQFDRPGLIATDMPKPLEDIVCKLLEKEPDKRFPDAYVLSLRLSEVQKRVAWAAAAKAAPAQISDSAAPLMALTEAGANPRSDDDSSPLAPTVLIPDAFGKPVPSGPTIATAESARAMSSPAMSMTMTSPSARGPQPPSGETSQMTRRESILGQGPGTIMRNLMRKAIAEQQAGTAISRAFDNMWIQVISLLLLIFGGVWWFQSREQPPAQRFETAEAILAQDEKTVEDLVKAKELLDGLVREDPDSWEAKAEPHLARIRFNLAKAKLRGSRYAKGSSNSEPKRILSLAQEYLLLGDAAQAERMLDSLLVLTTGLNEKGIDDLRADAESMLQMLRTDRNERAADRWLTAALTRAETLAAKNDLEPAQAIWHAVIELYASDPGAARHVEKARQRLQQPRDSQANSSPALPNSDQQAPPTNAPTATDRSETSSAPPSKPH